MGRRRGTARRWVAPILLLAAAVLAVTGPGTDAQEAPMELSVQGASSGGIEGAVTIFEGGGVPDARITFLDQVDERFVGRTFTDADGEYNFLVPASGCYIVLVDTPVHSTTDQIHSMRAGFCVGDIGLTTAALELS